MQRNCFAIGEPGQHRRRPRPQPRHIRERARNRLGGVRFQRRGEGSCCRQDKRSRGSRGDHRGSPCALHTYGASRPCRRQEGPKECREGPVPSRPLGSCEQRRGCSRARIQCLGSQTPIGPSVHLRPNGATRIPREETEPFPFPLERHCNRNHIHGPMLEMLGPKCRANGHACAESLR